jgi:hypothetical protein
MPTWDTKRKIIWLVAGLTMGTFVAFSNAHDEDGTFVPRFFIFMETLILIIIAVLFFIYSRKRRD